MPLTDAFSLTYTSCWKIGNGAGKERRRVVAKEMDGKTPGGNGEYGEEAGAVTGGADGRRTPVTERIREMLRSGELSVGGLLVTLALIAAVIVSGVFCAKAFGQYHALRSQYRGAVREASETLAAAEAERAEADPGSETSAALRQQTSEAMIEEARTEIARIERHNDELDEAARQAEVKIGKLDTIKDYDYYRAIYDEYTEGRAYVEQLLAED